MAIQRVTCSCGALLSRDERQHYLYQCSLCVMREHDLILAHGRGEEHPDIERLFSGPVEIEGLMKPEPIPLRRAS
jgi:hypothetical protein